VVWERDEEEAARNWLTARRVRFEGSPTFLLMGAELDHYGGPFDFEDDDDGA
jgi:hypothetical protein